MEASIQSACRAGADTRHSQCRLKKLVRLPAAGIRGGCSFVQTEEGEAVGCVLLAGRFWALFHRLLSRTDGVCGWLSV